MRLQIWVLFLLAALAGCGPDAERPARSPTAIAPPATSTIPPARPSTTPTNVPTAAPTAQPPAEPAYSYPIGLPGQPLGDGFFIRHGFQTENTWYNPGYWHTGEDWYAQAGDTAGAGVYAIAAGQVVYAGANYPGRVVLIQHESGIVSMYGHLDPALSVSEGQQVVRGTLLGQVLRRADGVPSHLHFELRTFVISGPVNGAAPRYDFRCGVNCPPGPGYWPIDAPELPSALGWLNPAHALARRSLPENAAGEAVVASQPFSASLVLWSAPPGEASRAPAGELALAPNARYRLLAVWAGPEASPASGAAGYQVWYQLALPGGATGWAAAVAADPFERGGDGRASSVRFNLLPAVLARP